MSKKKFIVGIDSGSTMCKTVIFDGSQIIDFDIRKTGWNPELSAKRALETILQRKNLGRDQLYISATGYGRESIDFADYIFTEITCHAYGAMYLLPGIQGVIDIGGQDSKVIQIHKNRVVDFLMNDKCAAGTGRFLSMACETLELPIDKIDDFTHPSEAVSITSMCTVFAESEIIGLLSMQTDRSKIMAGVLQSIGYKVKQMVARLDFDHDRPLLMTGGLSKSQALLKVIAQLSDLTVKTHKEAPFAGAIGATICADQKIKEIS